MKRWKLLPVLCLLASLSVWPAVPAQAAAPPGPYFNGFEKNLDGWFDLSTPNHFGHITRQQSGFSNAGGYADGITSAAGSWHARMRGDPCFSPPPPAVPKQDCAGPNTNWGGYSSTFPPGGYRTQVDIYFDVAWAGANPDVRFDWSSAINTSQSTGVCPDGNAPPCFRRDFVFNASTKDPKENPLDPEGFRIQSSTNAFRSGANPNFPCPAPFDPPNSCRPPAFITSSGWYTFRHTFRDDGSGFLAVDFDIFPLGSNVALAHWTIDGNRTPDADPMSQIGGNRYGWFANEEIADLAIDNSLRTGLCRSGDGDGDVEDKDSGRHGHAHFSGKNCEGGSQGGDVEESDQNSGDNFQSGSVNSATFTQDESSQTLTMVGSGTHNGLPVAFTMIAVDNGGLAPGVFSLLLSDGFTLSGAVLNGVVTIQ